MEATGMDPNQRQALEASTDRVSWRSAGFSAPFMIWKVRSSFFNLKSPSDLKSLNFLRHLQSSFHHIAWDLSNSLIFLDREWRAPAEPMLTIGETREVAQTLSDLSGLLRNNYECWPWWEETHEAGLFCCLDIRGLASQRSRNDLLQWLHDSQHAALSNPWPSMTKELF